MDLLRKLAEISAETKPEEKTAAIEQKVVQEEERYSPAERVKIGAANLINFVAAVKADGGHIKKASANTETNHELIKEVAQLYVDDHCKEASDSKSAANDLLGRFFIKKPVPAVE